MSWQILAVIAGGTLALLAIPVGYYHDAVRAELRARFGRRVGEHRQRRNAAPDWSPLAPWVRQAIAPTHHATVALPAGPGEDTGVVVLGCPECGSLDCDCIPEPDPCHSDIHRADGTCCAVSLSNALDAELAVSDAR